MSPADIIQAGEEVGLRLERHNGGYRLGHSANQEGFWIDWIPADRIESVIERASGRLLQTHDRLAVLGR